VFLRAYVRANKYVHLLMDGHAHGYVCTCTCVHVYAYAYVHTFGPSALLETSAFRRAARKAQSCVHSRRSSAWLVTALSPPNSRAGTPSLPVSPPPAPPPPPPLTGWWAAAAAPRAAPMLSDMSGPKAAGGASQDASLRGDDGSGRRWLVWFVSANQFGAPHET
jgi:hypothetical protein